MNRWNEFYGPNAGYVLELYERYRQDPASVDPQTRAFFEQNPPPDGAAQVVSIAAPAAATGIDPAKIAGAAALAQAIRNYGHWASPLDPLGTPPPGDPALNLDTYGLTESDLRQMPASVVGGVAAERVAAEGGSSAWDALAYLRQVYSGPVGYDFLQIRNPEERDWLRDAAESSRFAVSQQPIDPVELLKRLTEVEAFESFLQRSFVAKTRFSIEGVDMLIPLLDQVIGGAANAGIYNILIGMAHRGRLNVLAHILNKPVNQILAEFKDPLRRRVLQNEPTGWQGDVKYHAGGRRVIDTDEQDHTVNLTIQMAPNPSHLEAVNPVVEGMARAAGTHANQPGPAIFNPSVTLPILIHGDAAFTGQGVVAETLNMYRLPGYETGGTIHIIANNQIGFTATPGESRSTLFASDLAKGYRIPIIHVNADDPEEVITAARMAFAYRERYQNDFLIDLIGYRRLGHNEGDEPAFTQPEMYQKITAHPTVRRIWADQLVARGVIPAEMPDQLYQEALNRLQTALEQLDPEALEEPIPPPPPPGAARKVNTAVPAEQLIQINADLARLPEGFTVNKRLERILQRRRIAKSDGAIEPANDADWPSIDWSVGEELAFATILADGIPIRLTGQDTERGTFSHRHAVLHDAQTGAEYIPLQSFPEAKASFEIHNSPLSEYAALGFEFGYNVQAGDRLVIWEAQYGDFINNAQAVVDEFLTSARDKWGELPSLVVLLPHGYEGQGPDHSSGRLERFLNLSGDNNLRVAYCTTAANYFHLLRRQAALLTVDPLPLIVMTPKSLLRHPLVASPLRAFSEGGWQPVIDRFTPFSTPPRQTSESTPELPPVEKVRRLILCTGKVYVDLVTSEVQPQHPEVDIARVEQLAPFPLAEVQALIGSYPELQEVVWVQEEPENMGAWDFVRPSLEKAVGNVPLRLVARPRSASPAEGSNNLHTFNQRKLVEQAFTADSTRRGQKNGSQEVTKGKKREDTHAHRN